MGTGEGCDSMGDAAPADPSDPTRKEELSRRLLDTQRQLLSLQMGVKAQQLQQLRAQVAAKTSAPAAKLASAKPAKAAVAATIKAATVAPANLVRSMAAGSRHFGAVGGSGSGASTAAAAAAAAVKETIRSTLQ